MFRALRHRDLRIFSIGQAISWLGTWTQDTAQIWLIFRLTHSSLAVGGVNFACAIPNLIGNVAGGSVADRYDRRKVLVFVECVCVLQALTLALLTYWRIIEVWHIACMAVILGMVRSIGTPVQDSLLPEMAGKEDVGSAISINLALVYGTRMLGPSLAGFLIAKGGESLCFSINAASFIAVIATFLLIRLNPRPTLAAAPAPLYRHITDGAAYLAQRRDLMMIMALLALMGVLGRPINILMTTFVVSVLKTGPATLGYLMGALGAGALGGAMLLNRNKRAEQLWLLVGLGAMCFGIGIFSFSYSGSLWSAIPCLMVAGAGLAVHFVGSNTLVQTISPDIYRGRMLSFSGVLGAGTVPFGGLLLGFMADKVGILPTIRSSSFLLLTASIAYIVLRARSLSRRSDEPLPA